ncbi:DUF4030 domain-containing protein [Bacillus mycoides]|uniref:DUF4030 domain-containing protein n=1 Tax=Bacillus mycoides TaxID=1405 RepID=UPI00292DA6FC|nr:DUF4030 domain-containing protein [Bacillus mycoides]WOA60985.1 DUF4030 domain-containing protein [Bacillus mycoides]
MKSGKTLFTLLFSLVLLCSFRIEKGEEKSEESKVMDTIMETVGDKDFLSASMNDTPGTVDLEIADNVNSNKIKKAINAQLKNQDIRPYTINVSQRNMDIVKKEHRWSEVYASIFHEVFTKSGYKGFGIQPVNFESNQPFTLAIHTTINNKDLGAKDFGKKIEKEINDLLKTKKVKKWIENDSYTVEIYNQDEQKIN